jgi:acetyl esterase/lipase
MTSKYAAPILFSAFCALTASNGQSPDGEAIPIWPDLAPGETTKSPGTPLPARPADPTITRVTKVTHPTMRAYLPKEGATGAAVVVLPGGGFRYVVPNLEGSEAATFLNALGTAVFVLNYRTTEDGKAPERWRRPLQDSQRAIRFLRANAKRWSLDPKKIGLLAFSAGGQVGAIHIGDFGDAYEKIDAVDEANARPDFAMLIYPWNVANSKGEMMSQVKISKSAPPTFLVHTDDDRSSALGSVGIYTALHRAGVSGEIHVYKNGGHGYGTRARKGSMIGSWTERATDWLRVRGLAE